MKQKNVFIWEAKTLDGNEHTGIFEGLTKSQVIEELQGKNLFQLSMTPVPPKIVNGLLSDRETIDFLASVILMLNAGMSLIESFELLLNENRSLSQRFIFCHLWNSLQAGKSLQSSLSSLKKKFTPLFLTMVEIAEQSGKLVDGLRSLQTILQAGEQRKKELKKILRYPKIVFLTTVLLTFGVVVFIIPMFKNIYSLFGDDLPFFTKTLLFLSDFFHNKPFEIVLSVLILILGSFVPFLRRINPFSWLKSQLLYWIQSTEDHLLYAQAMRMMLENGIPLDASIKKAAGCLSLRNRKSGFEIAHKLDAGCSLSKAFNQSSWFPPVFVKLIASAEKAGQLATGFHHIGIYLAQKREENFSRWHKLIEPCMMMILGTLVLVILLAIYLPIFDLGNRVG